MPCESPRGLLAKWAFRVIVFEHVMVFIGTEIPSQSKHTDIHTTPPCKVLRIGELCTFLYFVNGGGKLLPQLRGHEMTHSR